MAKKTIGWREWIGLPDLNVGFVKAKIDTGARTSALHAFDIKAFDRNGERWVSFKVHPLQHSDDIAISCEAPVVDYRGVTDSGGHRSKRYVIATTMKIGDDEFSAEMTLVNRKDMLFRMLLGRTAMKTRYVVDPNKSYCFGRHHEDETHKKVTQ